MALPMVATNNPIMIAFFEHELIMSGVVDMKHCLIAAMAIVLFGAPAQAGCYYGEKNLPGSLGSWQKDNSRSFTVHGSARFEVHVVSGGPIRANLGCGWSVG